MRWHTFTGKCRICGAEFEYRDEWNSGLQHPRSICSQCKEGYIAKIYIPRCPLSGKGDEEQVTIQQGKYPIIIERVSYFKALSGRLGRKIRREPNYAVLPSIYTAVSLPYPGDDLEDTWEGLRTPSGKYLV